MLRRRLPCPPKASPMLLAGCPECTGTIPVYQPPYGRPARAPRMPSTPSRQATFDTRGSRFRETPPHFRTGSRQYMSSAGLSQKVAAQFRETGRHGLGSHIHGVAACVECRGTTLRAQKSFFIESHGYQTDRSDGPAQPEQQESPAPRVTEPLLHGCRLSTKALDELGAPWVRDFHAR